MRFTHVLAIGDGITVWVATDHVEAVHGLIHPNGTVEVLGDGNPAAAAATLAAETVEYVDSGAFAHDNARRLMAR